MILLNLFLYLYLKYFILNLKPMKNLKLLIALSVVVFVISSCKEKPPVDPIPVASFSVSNSGCTAPCTVTFTNTSKDATDYSWDFGDGSATSTTINPTHEYSIAGNYVVKLTAAGVGGTGTSTNNVEIKAPAYYITFKAGGVPVSLTELDAIRKDTANPRILELKGSGTGSTDPSFKITTSESSIGFVAGLNIVANVSTFGVSDISYTDASGNGYISMLDFEGMNIFISEISYTNGGIIKGTFSGKMKNFTLQQIVITEGNFRLKFSN